VDRSELGIVIPAYNEAETIATVIGTIKDLGTPIVVDDGSSDDTGHVAETAGAVLVTHKSNCGYDIAINSGFEKAAKLGCKYVITMDADGQHDPALMGDFLRLLHTGTDIVLGVCNKQQRFAEILFAWFSRLTFGIRDPLCGMKGYRIELYRQRGHFDSYGSIGTELAVYGVRSGYSYEQIEVPIQTRIGKPRFGRSLQANLRILRAALLCYFKTTPMKKYSKTRS